MFFQSLTIIAALAFEAGSVLLLLTTESDALIVGYLVFHLFGCLLFATSMTDILSRSYQSPAIFTWLFTFSFSFFIPCIGAFAFAGLVMPRLLFPVKISADVLLPWEYTSVPDLPERFPKMAESENSAEGSIFGRLYGSSDPLQRQEAVLQTLRLSDVQAIPLLKTALKDAEDDVRLLAYALLDRKEQKITGRIREAQRQLDQSSNQALAAKIHRSIAQDCWELIYVGLAQGEVLKYLLAMACKHTEQALKLKSLDAGLHFMLGKILLRQGEWELAIASFHEAERLGIGYDKTRSYLAEVAFMQRRYREILSQLEQSDLSISSPILQDSIRYWTEPWFAKTA